MAYFQFITMDCDGSQSRRILDDTVARSYHFCDEKRTVVCVGSGVGSNTTPIDQLQRFLDVRSRCSHLYFFEQLLSSALL